MTFYALYNVTFEYLAFDISTTVTQETVSSQEFPAVTICNHNRHVVTLLSEFSYTGPGNKSCVSLSLFPDRSVFIIDCKQFWT